MNIREINSFIYYHLGLVKNIFIHIPKNGGVSVRKHPELTNRVVSADPYFHLSRDYSKKLHVAMKLRGEHHGFQHARYRDIAHKVRSRLQAVAVVRNPWSRVVSRYRFARTAIENGKAPSNYVPDSFEGFLEERFVYGNEEYYWHRAIRGWYPQLEHLINEEGEVGVDVLRFENLNKEAVRYFNLKKGLDYRNVTTGKHASYQEYYTDYTRQLVADWYLDDIDYFGFEFNGTATKNTSFVDY
jgi:hypothetical protein